MLTGPFRIGLSHLYRKSMMGKDLPSKSFSNPLVPMGVPRTI